MKRCPTCNQTFTDSHLSFCVDDGTPLLPVASDAAADPVADETTVVRSSSGSGSSSADSYKSPGAASESPAPAYQPPRSYVPPGTAPGYGNQPGKRRIWPWFVGVLVIVLVVFAGLGIAAVILIPRTLRGSNTDNANVYVVPNNSNSNRGNANANSSNWNENLNSNSTADDTTPAPTDEVRVLSDLTDLEHEWTVANINADKKKLNHILADDYVGTLPNGHAQGKAEYLSTATRDEAIQKWEFEDLKVSLRGDRATLTGVLQVEIKDEQGENQSLAFRFTDKFVWRDGRWQATASEVSQLKQQGTAA